jgi:hypothetical protein
MPDNHIYTDNNMFLLCRCCVLTGILVAFLGGNGCVFIGEMAYFLQVHVIFFGRRMTILYYGIDCIFIYVAFDCISILYINKQLRINGSELVFKQQLFD